MFRYQNHQGKWQDSGSSVKNLLYPNKEGIRGEMKQRGIKPKNHHQKNLVDIRKKEVEVRVKKEIENSPPPNFKLKEFENVPPKVFDDPQYSEINTPENKKKKKVDMNACQNISTRVFNPIDPNSLEKKPQKKKKIIKKRRVVTSSGRVKKKKSLNSKRKTSSFYSKKKPKKKSPKKNYIKDNMRRLSSVKKKKKKILKKKLPKSEYEYGEVPGYLIERKLIWEEKERRKKERRRKRRQCPKGMTIMPESERVETLGILLKNKTSVETELRKLPITKDSIGIRKRRSELETKVTEIEDAIKLFSKKKVFIAEDS